MAKGKQKNPKRLSKEQQQRHQKENETSGRHLRSDSSRNETAAPLLKRPVQKKRAKPGAAALRDIRMLQKTTHLLIPKAPFLRIVTYIKPLYIQIRFLLI